VRLFLAVITVLTAHLDRPDEQRENERFQRVGE
jgi:hypothetical protein